MGQKELDEYRRQEREESLRIMQTPPGWFMWPVLPVKRRKPDGGWPDLGIMIDVDEHRHKVFRVGLYSLKKNVPLEEQLHGIEVDRYESLEEVIEAGWVVD